jgi:hypothetical protein
MRHALLLIAASMLPTGCDTELPKEKAELYAAVAYVTWGMEEGPNKFSAQRVERKTLSDAVQYTVFSKQEGPAGMTMTVRSPKQCVFTIEGMRTDGVLHTIDFNKATTFEFESSPDSFAYVDLEGPQVFCEGIDCKNEKVFLMLEQRGSMSLEENRAIGIRKSRAVDFIKKNCPGKPF